MIPAAELEAASIRNGFRSRPTIVRQDPRSPTDQRRSFDLIVPITRRFGEAWRFSRSAVIAWLAGTDPVTQRPTGFTPHR